MKLHPTTDSRIKTAFQTLEKRLEVAHNYKYDYTDAVYINSTIKMAVLCPTHGTFLVAPANHIKGKGCPECGRKTSGIRRRKSFDTFKSEATLQHSGKYTYYEETYTTAKEKTKILCHNCNTHFFQTPDTHLRSNGCPKCSILANADRRLMSVEEFTCRANKLHANKYSYEKVIYTKAINKVVITCPIHGDFNQRPADHLDGHACPICAKSGFDNSKTGLLYYVKVEKDGVIRYKIGITNRDVKARFRKDFQYITILLEEWYVWGQNAYDKEQQILKENKMYQNNTQILKDGNTEMFTIDVLNLDKSSDLARDIEDLEIITQEN